jgi:hypothetical protein
MIVGLMIYDCGSLQVTVHPQMTARAQTDEIGGIVVTGIAIAMMNLRMKSR